MMRFMFIGNNPKLEAAFDEIPGSPCAIITHPHPLYGGNMHNNAVMAARNAARANGFSALRFNFRGTGMSGGIHDDGKGEVDDIASAVDFAGGNPLLIGYSFGAWVASMYLVKNPLPCILISPPTAMFDVSLPVNANVWVIASDMDQYADMSKVKLLVPQDRLTICRGIDHFWFGHEDMLIDKLNKILAGMNKPA
jgi:hypothetical protein